MAAIEHSIGWNWARLFWCCGATSISRPAVLYLPRDSVTCLKKGTFKTGVRLFKSKVGISILWKNFHKGYFPSVTGNKASFAISVWLCVIVYVYLLYYNNTEMRRLKHFILHCAHCIASNAWKDEETMTLISALFKDFVFFCICLIFTVFQSDQLIHEATWEDTNFHHSVNLTSFNYTQSSKH